MIENLISAAVPETSWLPMNVPPCTTRMESVFLGGRVGPLPGFDQDLREERTYSPGGGTEGVEGEVGRGILGGG